MKALLFASLVFIGSQVMAADCFYNSAVTGFEGNGQNSVIVQSVQGRYQVDTFVCLDLEWANAIAFESWSGSAWICKGDDLYIVDGFGHSFQNRCRISNVTKLQAQ